MANGTVKFFDSSRGFGFIETDASSDDVFFHVDDVEGGEPKEGEKLEFDITAGSRGPRAANVKRA